MQKLANQPRRLSNRELPALVTQALAGFKVEPKSIQLLRSNIHQTFSIVGANHSGTTFRNSRFVLKIRSSDFRSVKATDEEVRWLEFLSRSPLGCAPPIRTQRGSTSHAFTGRSGERYLALLTRWTFGTNVGSQTRTAAQFVRLGELIGQMHQYGSGFPSQFRNELMPRNFFRANRRVGALSAMKSIGPKDLTVLLEAVRFLKSEFEDYERSTSNKHGFIHGDLYFGNLIVQKDRSYRAIDFDECGYGAFAFDLSTAFRQLKNANFSQMDRFRAALFAGYTRYRNWSKKDETMTDLYLVARKLQLLGWLSLNKYDIREPRFFRTAVADALTAVSTI